MDVLCYLLAMLRIHRDFHNHGPPMTLNLTHSSNANNSPGVIRIQDAQRGQVKAL